MEYRIYFFLGLEFSVIYWDFMRWKYLPWNVILFQMQIHPNQTPKIIQNVTIRSAFAIWINQKRYQKRTDKYLSSFVVLYMCSINFFNKHLDPKLMYCSFSIGSINQPKPSFLFVILNEGYSYCYASMKLYYVRMTRMWWLVLVKHSNLRRVDWNLR